MQISFWKRMAFYIVLSLIIMVSMSFFADDSDARAATLAASPLGEGAAPDACRRR